MSRTFLLQDWVTIRGASSLVSLTQDEERWLDLDGFSDATCWIDVAEVTPPGGTSTNYVTLAVETAAVCDDAYFTAMIPSPPYGSTAPFNVAGTTPLVVRSIRSATSSNLMRYIRWKITPNTGALWDLTFRVRVVATRSNAFSPLDMSGCLLWLRGDAGISGSATGGVSNWKDLSGNGNDVSQSNTAIQPTWLSNGINGQPAVHFVQATKQVLFSTSTPTLAGSACMVAVVSPTAGSTFKNTRLLGVLNSGGNFAYYLGSNDGTGTQWRIIVNNVWGTAAGTNAAGNYVLVGNYDASITTGKLYQNGAVIATDAAMTSPPSYASAFNVGSTSGDTFTNDYFNGNIAEVLFYNRSLNVTELKRLHRYLGARYNIAVP